MNFLGLMALLGPCFLLTACDSDQVQACETQLKEKLKSPASYKRIKVDITKISKDINDPPYDDVTITYDAANSYNALLRDKESCLYHPGTTNQFNPFGFGDLNATDMNATDMNATDMNATALDVNEATASATATADAALRAADEAVENANDAIANSEAG